MVKVAKLSISAGPGTQVIAVPDNVGCLTNAEQHGIIAEILAFLADASPGETLTIDVDELTVDAYDALQEFDGW